MGKVEFGVIDPSVEYRDIPGFPGYRVGLDGSVWSNRRPWLGLTQLRTHKDEDGYMVLELARNCKGLKVGVHRLLLLAFVGPCPDGMEACHHDGIRSNNVLSNLRWDTCKGNQGDRLRHGTDTRGERNGRARVTKEQVQAIRLAYAEGRLNQVQLGRKYGICVQAVNNIVWRKTWKNVG